MGVEEFFKQEEERFIRDNLMSDEVLDFIRENTLPFNQLMAYYRCAIMEVETKFKVLNEQFSLQYDRNPIESIKTRIKSTEGIIKKANRKKIPFTMQAIEENIRDIAGISSIVIKPWDKSMFRVIEKAIIDSDLGIMPENNGEMIRIGIPPLTEERRKQLAKQCKGEGETAKVSVRNARRDGIDALKKAVKDGLAEDEQKNAEAKLQKIHDKYIKQIDDMLAEKDKEIMTV